MPSAGSSTANQPDERNMVSGESLKKKTFKGTLWGAVERFSQQGISFVVTIIMARILTPADYGLVGMVLVFVNVAQSLVDSGFSQALIQKKDRDETDNSTAFYFNVGIGIILYAALWFLAPVIARFYSEPRLVWITRLVALGIFSNAFGVVQRALLSVVIDFKTQAKASMIAAMISGTVGITMAYTGWGVWSIVAYNVINLLLGTGLLWVYSKWRPAWLFSWQSFHQIFGFGSKLAVSGFLHNLYLSSFNMIIGKVFKAADLGFYTRGQQFVAFFSSNLSGVLQRVSYPVLCRFQDEDVKLGDIFIKLVRASSLLLFTLMMGLAGVAKPMIGMLLGEKWIFSATLMQVLCLGYMWFALYSLNLNILLVKGKTGLYLRLEIIKKLLFIGVLIAAVPFGLVVMCWAVVVNSLIEVLVNSFYTKKLIGISIWKQFAQLVPAFLYAVSMGAVVWMVVTWIPGPHYVKFTVGVVAGLVYFFGITTLTKSRDLRFMLSLLKRERSSGVA